MHLKIIAGYIKRDWRSVTVNPLERALNYQQPTEDGIWEGVERMFAK